MGLRQVIASKLSQRSRSLGIFFVTSLAARGVGIACQLLQVPIVMRALGAEAFGLWMTLTGIGALILFSDFGVGQGAQNKLAEAFAANREDEARRLWGSTVLFFAAVAVGLLLILGVTVRALDFTSLFSLTDPATQREASAAVAVALGLYCLNFPLGLGQRLAYSRQLGWMHNLTQAATGLGALAGTWFAVRQQWSLPAIIAAAQVPVLVGNGVLLAVLLQRFDWWRPSHWSADRATLRELLRLGAYFGIQQLQLTILLSLPALVISTTLGAAAVTPYNLAQRLFNLFAVVQNAFMLPLWPAYSEAKARGEFGWIRRTLTRSLAATLLLTIVPMALGALCARPILGWWVGTSEGLPTTALVWLLFAWNAVVFLQQPFGYLLSGLSVVRRPTFFAVISTVTCALLMMLLVGDHAQPGVVTGMIVGYLPFFLFGSVFELMRVFRELPREDLPGGLASNPVEPALPTSLSELRRANRAG